jgi:hypothetical protein
VAAVAVNLSDCVGVSSAGVSEFCATLPGLFDVCLFGCLYLDDACLLGLGKAESRIQRLNLGGVYKARRSASSGCCWVDDDDDGVLLCLRR